MQGGFMSYRLGCEASDVFAAVAVVSAVLGNKINLAMGSTQQFACKPPRTVPLLHVHGTKDELVTYGGNPLFGWVPAKSSAKAWAVKNGCDGSHKDLTNITTFQNRSTATNSSVQCVQFCGGSGDQMSNVTLCTIQGGTHAWPGGRCGGKLGACTLAIPGYATLHLVGEPLLQTSDEIWRFFHDKRMPASVQGVVLDQNPSL
jgi:polyhydroxybutyrate depolymerase